MAKQNSELGRSKGVFTARVAETVMRLCLCLLIVHTVLLSHGGALARYFVSKVVTTPGTLLHFDLVNCDLQGAELYVNGVCLGTLPLAILRAEFVDKVPVWREPPAPLDRSEIPESLREYLLSGRFHPRGESLFYPIFDSLFDSEKTEYYAQVKYQGQWCYAVRGGSGGGGNRHKHQGLEFVCPAYEQRLAQLLDLARVNDYQVPQAWFEAMETYGRDGVIALLKAVPEEPGMNSLLDQMASREFGLDQVHDEATAWQAFERICHAVTKAKAYSTEGLEGRAVALLAPELPVAQLTRQAIGLVRRTNSLGGKMEWQARGKTQFGVTYEGARFVSSLGRSNRYIGQRVDQPPVSGYAVAHALWCLFEQGDSKVNDAFQNHIVPEMIGKYYPNLPWYPFFSAMGGSAVERYLLRQDWESDLKQLTSPDERPRLDANFQTWLSLCAQLESEAGERFRQRHRGQLFQMADQVDPIVRFKELDFLFVNLDRGTDSLALQYWPRFLNSVLTERIPPFKQAEVLFDYLIKMEPLAEPQMYVDVFLGATRQHDLEMGLKKLSLLPLARRQVVCDALKNAVMQDVSHLEGRTGSSEAEDKHQLLSALDEIMVTDQEKTQKLFDNMSIRKSSQSPVNWLSQSSEDHPVVPMLAHSDRPDLRRLALYAVEAHPSPAHKILLDQLLLDTDPEVNTAARAVEQNLEDLANLSPETLRAK